MRSAAALTFILHNSALCNQLVGGLWGGQMQTHHSSMCHIRGGWTLAWKQMMSYFPTPVPFFSEAHRCSFPQRHWSRVMTVHPCPRVNDSTFFQPEHKCLSIKRVYRLLNAAERGEQTPAERMGLGRVKLIKDQLLSVNKQRFIQL